MGKKRVLVVDDSPFILRMLSFLLKKEGMEVRTAANGTEALGRLQAEGADLVFLDVMMPGLNGYQVLERMKADPALAGIPVIMITAKGQERDRRRAEGLGVDGFITKPFSPSALAQKLRELLAKKGART